LRGLVGADPVPAVAVQRTERRITELEHAIRCWQDWPELDPDHPITLKATGLFGLLGLGPPKPPGHGHALRQPLDALLADERIGRSFSVEHCTRHAAKRRLRVLAHKV
jgi:hypothetical protein